MGDEDLPPALRCGQLMVLLPGGSAWHLAYVLEAVAAGEVRLRIVGPGREGEECVAPIDQLRDASEMARLSRASTASRVPGTMLAGEWAILRCPGTPDRLSLVQMLEDATDRTAGRLVRVREYCEGALHAREPVAPQRLFPLADLVAELERRIDRGRRPVGWTSART